MSFSTVRTAGSFTRITSTPVSISLSQTTSLSVTSRIVFHIRHMGKAQDLSHLRSDLSGITVDGLTATGKRCPLGPTPILLTAAGQDLGGSEGIGTAELAAGDQHAAVSAAGHQLTQHTLCRRRAHGDDDDLAAGLVLQLQGGLDGVQVVRGW